MDDHRESFGRVLVVDDEEANRRLLERILTREGHTVLMAADGVQAIDLVARERPDLILLDIVMPGLDGFEVCRLLKRDPATRLTPIVLVTGLQEADHRIEGINAGADDFLTKPPNRHELTARVRSLVRLKKHTDDLESAEAVILHIAQVVEARDQNTEGHCQRLAAYAAALGERLGLPEPDLTALRRGGYLHDVGKIGIPDAVLLKPGRLTAEEYALMKTHTVIGDGLCGNLRSLQGVRPIVRHHHERLDGSGYPDGLVDGSVPLLAQIMSIVDLYDAMTTARPYKPAGPKARAVEELTAEAERGWRSRELVGEFIALVNGGVIVTGEPGGGPSPVSS